MTVKDLINRLGDFEPELEVVFSQFSDYAPLNSDQLEVRECYNSGSGHEHLEGVSDYNRKLYPIDRVKKYLTFPGN